MDYRIFYVIVWALPWRYVDTCTYSYDDFSCTYIETCDDTRDIYNWESFKVQDDETFYMECLKPIVDRDTGYSMHPVYLVLRKYSYIGDSDLVIPGAQNCFDEQMLDLIVYGLDLSNDVYTELPVIRLMSNLQKLNVSNNYLTSAKLSNRNALYMLTEIDFSNNQISDIEVYSYEKHYKALKVINLSHNQLKTLPDGIFSKFNDLQKLDLSYNVIDKLSLNTFENIKFVIDLNLSNNRLTDINSSLFRFSGLKILNISDNRIKLIKLTDFEQLQNLETLELSSNKIESINDDVFSTLISLKHLYLNSNQLKVLSKNTFSNLQSLVKIDISSNWLTSIPENLFSNTSVLHFSIENNKLLGSLERGMFEGINDTKLDLSEQFLTQVKDYAFYELVQLQVLLLNDNNIRSLSKMCFITLINLQHLDLSNNQITSIDFDKKDLNNLHTLLLKNNYLLAINYEHLHNLNNLQFLDLTGNQISQLEPRSFQSLKILIMLAIYNNSLTGTIETGTFAGLVLLPILDISRNKLITIQNASFNHMDQLKELNMSHCDIRELQFNTFINTKYIAILDISYNKLEAFNVNTTDLSRMTTILLNNNLIKVVESQSFYGLFQLNKVDLSHNLIENVDSEALNSLVNLYYLDLSVNEKLNFSVTNLKANKHLNKLYLSSILVKSNFSYLAADNSLLDLVLSNISVKNIHDLDFGKLAHLEILTLNYNKISKLQIGDFGGVTALKRLDLSFNQITSIQPGVFKDNTELYYLNVSHNYLSIIAYGAFHGLINLNVLDMSFNVIKDLQTENFYEVDNLSQLILDHNKIDTLNAEEFMSTKLAMLSIGNNPISCQTLAKLRKQGVPFEITAIRTDVYANAHVNGITCNLNRIFRPMARSEKIEDYSELLNELKDILYKLSNKDSEGDSADSKYLERISNNFEKSNSVYSEKLSNLVNLTSNVIAVNNNSSMIFNKNNILLDKILNLLNQSVAISLNISSIPRIERTTIASILEPPKAIDSKDNQSVKVILYINKIKKELENALAIERENIHRLESKFVMTNYRIESTLPTSKEHQMISRNESSKSLFTEICVALILLILLGLILYMFCKLKLFRRNRFSASSRELPESMENSSL